MKVFGPTDERSLQQLRTCIDEAAQRGDFPRGALMADHHPGYSCPIGGVVAYTDHISPSAVGYDIGCGNLAVRTDLKVADLEGDLLKIGRDLFKSIAFGVGRTNSEKVDHHVIDLIASAPFLPQRTLLDKARAQLGTVGSGNHYVDLFEDRGDGALWVGVHFGSRGFGHATASGFLALAQGLEFADRVKEGEMDSPPVLLDVESALGQDYIQAMTLAGAYAYAGRGAVVATVLKRLGAKVTFEVHNHHNYAWPEHHGGTHYWVHRKGATPAFPGQYGFVGANMRDDAVIIRGITLPSNHPTTGVQEEALFSTVHGAGRVMSRTQAAGKVKWRKEWHCGQRGCDYTAPPTKHRQLKGDPRPKCPACAEGKLIFKQWEERVKPGAIDWPATLAELEAKGVLLFGSDADEAPGAYKVLSEVLAHQGETIEVLHRLRPRVVLMAPKGTHDPYKD